MHLSTKRTFTKWKGTSYEKIDPCGRPGRDGFTRGDVQAKAIEILKDAADKELTSGRGQTGVAAASIYIASILCGERRTQREVADVAGVTEVTIRNRYKELAERLDIDIIL